MDTPAVPPPRDAREKAVLDRLVVIRDELLLLKQDRTTYIRSQDVMPLYNQVIEQVKELNAARVENGNQEENRGISDQSALSARACLQCLLQLTRLWRAVSSSSPSST